VIDALNADALGVVRDGLRTLGIPQRMLEIALQIVWAVEGILVYGSRARRDSVDGSDLDLLALVGRRTKSVHAEDVGLNFPEIAPDVGHYACHARAD
jgi:predicted nucleotidyltransferase